MQQSDMFLLVTLSHSKHCNSDPDDKDISVVANT